MTPETEQAYKRWMAAANGPSDWRPRKIHIDTFNRQNSKIARLKHRYEVMLRRDRAVQCGTDALTLIDAGGNIDEIRSLAMRAAHYARMMMLEEEAKP